MMVSITKETLGDKHRDSLIKWCSHYGIDHRDIFREREVDEIFWSLTIFNSLLNAGLKNGEKCILSMTIPMVTVLKQIHHQVNVMRVVLVRHPRTLKM